MACWNTPTTLAALAPIQKIAQPLGVRLHGLGVLEEGFLGKEFLNFIHDPFAIGIAVWLDRYATAHSVKHRLPALHGFDRCFEIHANGFDVSCQSPCLPAGAAGRSTMTN